MWKECQNGGQGTAVLEFIKHFLTCNELYYTHVYLSKSLRLWLVSTRAKDQPFCQYRRSHVSCLVFTLFIVESYVSGVPVDTDVTTRKMSTVATLYWRNLK